MPRRLSVADNGIGMSEQDLTDALGTIASSGTRAFLDRMAASKGTANDESESAEKAADLIGQFGIGFYSAFMVADEVEVDTRRAGADFAYRWTSDGKGSYAIAPLGARRRAGARHARDAAPQRGVAGPISRPYTLERIVREHSGAIAVPINLLETAGDEPKSLSARARRSGPSRRAR